MHRSRRLRKHFSEWRHSRSSRTVSRDGRRVHQCPRHSLPHRSLWRCGYCLLRRERDSFNGLLTAQPAEQSAQQRCGLWRQPLSLRLFGQFARTSSLRLGLFALAAIGFFHGGLGASTLAATIDPPVPQPLQESKPDRRPLPRRIEGKRRRQIERYCDHQSQNDRRARQIQVVNHEIRQQTAFRSFHRKRSPPLHCPRQQRDRRRRKHHPHPKPDRLRQRRTSRSRPHPADAQPSEDQRQKERGNPNQLQHCVGKISPDHARPIVCWPPRDIASYRVEGGISRRVAGQREHQQGRSHQYDHPDNLIQAAVSRRGRYESYGFHWGAFIEGYARPLSPVVHELLHNG